MKHILLKLFIVIIFFSVASFALAYSSSLNVNTSQDVRIVTEFQCKILNTNCVVDRVKYLQTGAVYYDAECEADHMTKSAYESDVINDVQKGYFQYCSNSGRTLN